MESLKKQSKEESEKFQVCVVCKKNLPLTSFRLHKSGHLLTKCYECENKQGLKNRNLTAEERKLKIENDYKTKMDNLSIRLKMAEEKRNSTLRKQKEMEDLKAIKLQEKVDADKRKEEIKNAIIKLNLEIKAIKAKARGKGENEENIAK